MRKRYLWVTTTMAAVVPTLAVAQARPAQPRPATPPAQQPRPANRPPAQQPRPAAPARPMAANDRTGQFELSAGVGAVSLDKAVFNPSTAIGIGGFVRAGYTISPTLGVSVGSGFGTVGSPSITVIQPFADLTYTMDINQKTSPFVLVGAGLTRGSMTIGNVSGRLTSTYGAHVGVGVRSFLNDNVALRVEGRMQYDHFQERGGMTGYDGAASVGLSYFTGAKKVVTAVAVTAPAATLAYAGATTHATATVHDQKGRPMTGKAVTWSSSNPSVARVDANGTVTAVGDGSAEITATSEGVRGSTRVTVARTVNSVTMTPTTGSINALGRTQQFTAAGKDQGNQPVANAMFTWTSSNPSVATVSPTGLATAMGTGTATITATANGKSATATLTVTQTVASVAVTPSVANVTAGATTQLAAAANDANSRPVSGKMFTWTSESPNVATVSTTGLVTGLAAGTARIMASTDGQSGAATVTVAAAAAPPRVGEGVWPELQNAGGSHIVTGINFVGRTARLAASSNAAISGLASMIKQVLQTNSGAKFEISGHTDNTGVAAANVRSSAARARAVRTALTRQGVPASALTAVGRGGADVKFTTPATRRQNNRIEIKRTN